MLTIRIERIRKGIVENKTEAIQNGYPNDDNDGGNSTDDKKVEIKNKNGGEYERTREDDQVEEDRDVSNSDDDEDVNITNKNSGKYEGHRMRKQKRK